MEHNPAGYGVMFADGYLAGKKGDSNTANPFNVRSPEAAAWIDGWNEGSTRRAWNEINARLNAC